MLVVIITLWLPLLGLSLEVLGKRTWGTGTMMLKKLKDQKVRRAFVLQVKNRFQALEHSEEEAETTEATRERVNSK